MLLVFEIFSTWFYFRSVACKIVSDHVTTTINNKSLLLPKLDFSFGNHYLYQDVCPIQIRHHYGYIHAIVQYVVFARNLYSTLNYVGPTRTQLNIFVCRWSKIAEMKQTVRSRLLASYQRSIECFHNSMLHDQRPISMADWGGSGIWYIVTYSIGWPWSGN